MAFQAKCEAVRAWIEGIIGEALEDDNLFMNLRSGAILCQLMNEVQQDSCPDFDPFPEQPEAERQNIEHYLQACTVLDIQDIFDVDDLLAEKNVKKVLANLLEVARFAEEMGLQGVALPPEEEAAAEEEPLNEDDIPVFDDEPAPPKKAEPVKAAAPAKTTPPATAAPSKAAPAGPAKTVPPAEAPKKAEAKTSVAAPEVKKAVPPASPRGGAPVPAAKVIAPVADFDDLGDDTPSSPAMEGRSRGETAMLMSWQPPKAGDETLKVENTRLKAQAERANITAQTQTKLKDEALQKLQKERERIKQLEQELEDEKRKKAAAPADSSKERDTLLRKQVEDLRAQVSELEERLEEEEGKARKAEARADEMERLYNETQQQLQVLQEEAAANEEALRHEVQQLQNDALYLTGELNRLKEANAETGNAANSASDQIELLRAQLEEERASNADLNARLAEQRAKINELTTQNAEAKTRAASNPKAPAPTPTTPAPTPGGASKSGTLGRSASKTGSKGRGVPLKAAPAPGGARTSAPKVEDSAAGDAGEDEDGHTEELDMTMSMNVAELESTFEMAKPTVIVPGKKPTVTSTSAPPAGFTGRFPAILEGKPVTGLPTNLDAEFSKEETRRLFGEAVKAATKDKRPVALGAKEFDVLVSVFSACCRNIDSSKPSDFTCAKSLLKAGALYSRKDGRAPKFLRNAACDFEVWKQPNFWDDWYSHRVNKAIDKHNAEGGQDVEGVVATVIEHVGKTMVEWGVSEDIVKDTVSVACDNEGLNPDEFYDRIFAGANNNGGGGSAAKPVRANSGGKATPGAPATAGAPTDGAPDEIVRSGSLKFKKGAKWVKANFLLTTTRLSYDYTEEGVGDFSESVLMSEIAEASAQSDQAPGALRNYSLKLLKKDQQTIALHLLAAKQPEVGEWISAINKVLGVVPSPRAGSGGSGSSGIKPVSPRAEPSVSPRGKSGSNPEKVVVKAAAIPERSVKSSGMPVPSGNTPAKKATSPRPTVPPPAAADSSSGGGAGGVLKEGDVKMLVNKRWLRTHIDLFDANIVLSYVDPNTNVSVREDIPLKRMLIAPGSPQAPAALKDSSFRIKDGDTEYHLMCSAKTEVSGWLQSIKTSRDALK